MNTQEGQRLLPQTEIRYVGMGEITIYFVSDDELLLLQRGGVSSTFLNLAIFFISIAASFFASLLVSPPQSIRTFAVMVILIIASAIAGLVLILVWRKTSKDVNDIVRRIRGRALASCDVVEGTKIS